AGETPAAGATTGTTVTVPAPNPLPPVESTAVADARIAVQQLRRSVIENRDEAAQDRTSAKESRELSNLADRWDAELATASDDAAIRIADAADQRRETFSKRLAALSSPSAEPASEHARTRAAAATPRDARREVDPKVLAEMKKAFVAYGKGDLGGSKKILDRLVASGEAPGPALMLRGCARYTSGILGRNGEEIEGARRDFRKALTVDPRLKLDSNVFSPKLVAFFDQIRSEAKQK
ncbi:MAG: hypothetical protein WBX15_00365, partial [Thermoanaerobaculia bacterium]